MLLLTGHFGGNLLCSLVLIAPRKGEDTGWLGDGDHWTEANDRQQVKEWSPNAKFARMESPYSLVVHPWCLPEGGNELRGSSHDISLSLRRYRGKCFELSRYEETGTGLQKSLETG